MCAKTESIPAPQQLEWDGPTGKPKVHMKYGNMSQAVTPAGGPSTEITSCRTTEQLLSIYLLRRHVHTLHASHSAKLNRVNLSTATYVQAQNV